MSLWRNKFHNKRTKHFIYRLVRGKLQQNFECYSRYLTLKFFKNFKSKMILKFLRAKVKRGHERLCLLFVDF